MKYLAVLATLVFLPAHPGLAGPLQKDQVPANAKWLLHLDFDAFRSSKVGSYFLKEIAEKELAKAKADLKWNLDFGFEKIKSITAYGTDYELGSEASGVMLIKTAPQTQGILEAMFQLSQSMQQSNGPMKKLIEGKRMIYVIHDDFFIEPQPGDVLLVGKSRKHIDAAGQVLSHRGPAAGSGAAFAGFPTIPNSFFFLAVAEGFNQKGPMPPEAKILQMADGGRLALGEKADRLFVNVSLKGKNADVTRQIQNVIQGMVALVALSQSQNKELLELTQSLNVSSQDKFVTIGLEYPIGEAIKKLQEKSAEMKDHDKTAHAEDEAPKP